MEKKVLMKVASSQENFDATKHHRFNISQIRQHLVIDIQIDNVTLERKILVPGSRAYAEVSTPNRNERITISG